MSFENQPDLPIGDTNQAAQTGKTIGQPPRTSQLAIWSLVLGVSSLLCSFFAGLIGLVLGVIALFKISNSQGRLKGTGLAIAGIVCSILFSTTGVLMLLPAISAVRTAAQRTASANNMKQLGLAQLNYESAYMRFPAISGNAEGKGVGLSWRVHLLPILGRADLYAQFNLDEPWDSPSNKLLIEQMPEVYASPVAAGVAPGHTVYLRPTGNGAFDDGDGSSTSIGQITDGLSNTIMIVEANVDQAVPWTKPADYQFDPANPLRGLGELYPRGGFNAAYSDCSTHFLPPQLDAAVAKGIFTKAGGEVLTAP